jgi:hypothetical protein
MRHAITASLLSGAISLIALPTSTRAQLQSPTPVPAAATAAPRPAAAADPRVQAAAVVTPQPRPASPAVATTPRPAVTKPPRVQGSSYWGAAAPAAPKKKPSAFRRFLNRFGGGDDEHFDPEQGVKVTRDIATGRTNVLGSKPWQPPSP